jgi:hypothetical protein
LYPTPWIDNIFLLIDGMALLETPPENSQIQPKAINYSCDHQQLVVNINKTTVMVVNTPQVALSEFKFLKGELVEISTAYIYLEDSIFLFYIYPNRDLVRDMHPYLCLCTNTSKQTFKMMFIQRCISCTLLSNKLFSMHLRFGAPVFGLLIYHK